MIFFKNSIRLLFILIFWSGAYALLLWGGDKIFWNSVARWIEQSPRYSDMFSARAFSESAHWLLWISFASAILSGWILGFALIARQIGRGGGTIYETVYGWGYYAGPIQTYIPVGHEEPDEQEGKCYFYSALFLPPLVAGLFMTGLWLGRDLLLNNPGSSIIATVGVTILMCSLLFVVVSLILASQGLLFSTIRKAWFLLVVATLVHAALWCAVCVLCLTNVLKSTVHA